MKPDAFLKLLHTACKRADEELDRNLNYTESNYQNALLHYLRKAVPDEMVCAKEVSVTYKLSDGFCFGGGRIDIICEDATSCWILELKAHADRRMIARFSGQTNRYVKHYPTSVPKCGILIIFGSCSPIVKVLP